MQTQPTEYPDRISCFGYGIRCVLRSGGSFVDDHVFLSKEDAMAHASGLVAGPVERVEIQPFRVVSGRKRPADEEES